MSPLRCRRPAPAIRFQCGSNATISQHQTAGAACNTPAACQPLEQRPHLGPRLPRMWLGAATGSMAGAFVVAGLTGVAAALMSLMVGGGGLRRATDATA